MKDHRWKDVDRRGRLERLAYEAKTGDGRVLSKYALVYIPFGYAEGKPLDVLYLMHGGGGNPDAWTDASQIKNALDQSFGEERAKPFLVVFPGYYPLQEGEARQPQSMDDERLTVLAFQDELRNCLLPAVERRFPLPEGPARNHRAFGGFSMGGCTTWFAFTRCLDLFSVFLPLSGDSWEIERMGGRIASEETARALRDFVLSQGYTAADFRIFAGTGTKDIAYENLSPQIEAMKACADVFVFSEDPAAGNLHYDLRPDAVHAYEEVYHHVYRYLPFLFPA